MRGPAPGGAGVRGGRHPRREVGRAAQGLRHAQAGPAAPPRQEIIEFCRQHIAHFKCPAAVEFGDLPKTSTGKIQKFVLRDREWKGREKRIN